MMALTATATGDCEQDVINILQMTDCSTFKESFNRKNLLFEVRPKPKNKQQAMEAIVEWIKGPEGPGIHATGIIYCLSKNDTEELSDFLNEKGLIADYYHAGNW